MYAVYLWVHISFIFRFLASITRLDSSKNQCQLVTYQSALLNLHCLSDFLRDPSSRYSRLVSLLTVFTVTEYLKLIFL